MKRNYSYIYFIMILFANNANSQDVHFSQFLQTPQLINPAATGVFDGKVRAFLNYRSQWSAFGNGYKTYAASVDMPLAKSNNKAYFGLGLNFYKDAAGSSNFGNTVAALSASGILPVARNHTFSGGIQFGYGQYSANLANLTWGSQFNGSEFDLELNNNESILNQNSKYLDASAGLYYQFKNVANRFLGTDMSSFNIGIAGYHLNKPKQSFLSNTESELPMKIIAQASGTFDLTSTKVSLQPSMFYAIQGPFTEITPGMLLKLKFGASTKYTGFFKESAIYFGAHYRLNDAIIPQMYLEFADYMIGISYDYNTSDLSTATGGNGGFEISFRYVNKPKALQRASFK